MIGPQKCIYDGDDQEPCRWCRKPRDEHIGVICPQCGGREVIDARTGRPTSGLTNVMQIRRCPQCSGAGFVGRNTLRQPT